MDISKYKKYVRDMHIEDYDFKDIVETVIANIAIDTKVFKKIYAIDITSCQEYYNLKDIFDLNEALKNCDEIKDIKLDMTSEDIISYIENLGKDYCETDIKVKVEKEERECPKDYFLHINDVLYYSNDVNNGLDIFSVIDSWVKIVDNYNMFVDHKAVRDYLGIPYDKDYNLTLYGIAVVRPNPENINEEIEMVIQNAIIQGIKYYVKDMYLSVNDEQVGNILYQRFYSAKKQILYNYPQISGFDKIKNAYWNT